ncbi:MAG: GNAT family N-acetyltransferase [Bryobacteraceae bacterium]
MYQRWRTILMQDGLGVRQTPSVFPPGIDFRFHARHQNLPEAVRAQIYRAGGGEFLSELEDHDGVWVLLTGNGEAAGRSGVYFRSRQARLLALPEGAILLGGGYVAPRFRGRGLHRLAVNEVCRRLAIRGYAPVYTEVHPENVASLRGLEGAQLTRVREIDIRIILRRIVIDRKGVRWV